MVKNLPFLILQNTFLLYVPRETLCFSNYLLCPTWNLKLSSKFRSVSRET